MLSRRCALLTGAFLLLSLLSVLPAATAEPAGGSCAVLPWQGGTASAVSPTEQSPMHPLFDTSCTTSSQCPAGQACNCGQCHDACAVGQRWSCTCQVCYDRCPSGYFFDDSLCACAPI